MSPQVSVIVSHYDARPEWLGQAVHSILSQTLRDLELLVIDDATPNERWLQTLQRFGRDSRLSVWRTSQNVGTYRIKNAIFPHTSAPHIAFQDADDWSVSQRLERQLRVLLSTRADIVGCSFRYVDESGEALELKRFGSRPALLWKLGKRFVSLHPTLMLRRDVWQALGGFDGTARVAADDDFLTRAIHVYRIRNLTQPLYMYRRHARSLTLAAGTGHNSNVRAEYLRRLAQRNQAIWRVGRWFSCATPASLIAPPNDVPFTLERVTL